MENIHFRSTMDVEAQGEARPAFRDLVHEIADWIRTKEGPAVNLQQASFETGGTWKKPNGRASVETDSIREPDAAEPEAWAIRYSHQDSEFAARSWAVDIGVVVLEPGRWRFALTVRAADTEAYRPWQQREVAIPQRREPWHRQSATLAGGAEMIRTVEAIIDEKGQVSLLEPVRPASARRALVTILEEDPVAETALLSEAVLSEDWDRPEEDEAWADRQSVR
jgi:hypothetical protein